MNGHGITGEHGTRDGDRWVLRGRCPSLCGQSFVSRAATVQEARRVIRQKSIEHRVLAMLAGPGWTGER